MPCSAIVGVVANPASGRDVRRLVSGASVFDNGEKARMVHRVMAGLGAAGVGRVLMMPAGAGLSASLGRHLRGRTGDLARAALPALELADMPATGDAQDTVRAVELMARRGIAALVVLGGDGTHRLVARHAGGIPLCTLSTGTNNVFPEVREATVAGLATGLVATGRVPGGVALRREKRLLVRVDGAAEPDLALVDVTVTGARWTGARALWRPADVSELVVAFAEPGAVGWSGVAGLVEPVPRSAPHGLHLRLADPGRAPLVVRAPIAPGLVVPVGVAEVRRVPLGTSCALAAGPGCLALDGEREVALDRAGRVEVRLDADGPLTIDVARVMSHAARHGLLRAEPAVA